MAQTYEQPYRDPHWLNFIPIYLDFWKKNLEQRTEYTFPLKPVLTVTLLTD